MFYTEITIQKDVIKLITWTGKLFKIGVRLNLHISPLGQHFLFFWITNPPTLKSHFWKKNKPVFCVFFYSRSTMISSFFIPDGHRCQIDDHVDRAKTVAQKYIHRLKDWTWEASWVDLVRLYSLMLQSYCYRL